MDNELIGVMGFWGVFLGLLLIRAIYLNVVERVFQAKFEWYKVLSLPIGMQAVWPYSRGHFMAALWAQMVNTGLIEASADKEGEFIYKGQEVQEVEGFGVLRFKNLERKGKTTLINLVDLFSPIDCNALEIQSQLKKDLGLNTVFKTFKKTLDSEIKASRLPWILAFVACAGLVFTHFQVEALNTSLFYGMMLGFGLFLILEGIGNIRMRKALQAENSVKIRKNLEAMEFMQRKKNIPTLLSWDMNVSGVHQKEYGFNNASLHTFLALEYGSADRESSMSLAPGNLGSASFRSQSHDSEIAGHGFKTGHSFGGEEFRTSHHHNSYCGNTDGGGGSDSGGDSGSSCSGGGGCGGGGD